ncbi:MAG: exodeoxyribonuclease V subunit gamma [Vampirovibrionales bacterium]|jgi:DNA helicase-2/ATP-dependent DNA helicase PcrA|nr:exodeoxyribonuclease V subunit gamma [Vampirovibrionales bacterium]
MTSSLDALSPLLVGMNPAQAQAVAHGVGPLLVLAGAGSGKTKVLTHRIAHLLQGQGEGLEPVWASQVLSVTFTNKAAKEMKARLATLIDPSVVNDIWMGTFHSVCVRLLRRDIVHYTSPSGAKWKQNFVIYDEAETLAVIKDILKSKNLDEKLYPARGVKYQISAVKNQGLDAFDHATNAKDYKAERLSELFTLYEQQMAENNALDFDDLLLMTVKLLRQHPALLANYNQHFRHILVDEFQDTNEVQYDLIRMLATGQTSRSHEAIHWHNRSLTVVGDVDQSIYSWRGANFRICLGFQKDFKEAQLITLQDNYRSTAKILQAANAVIERNSERLPKELRAVKGDGEKIYCYEATDDRDEAHFVLEKLQDYAKRSNQTLNECAVLYRTNVQSRVIEDLLISRGIPYTMVGGIKFYERREVKDVLAYLTVLFNPDDSYSVKRVLNVPRRGIGAKTIEHIENYGRAKGISFYQALFEVDQIAEVKGKARQGIADFVTVMQRVTEQQGQGVYIDEVMLTIRQLSGYDKALEAEDPKDEEGRLANLDELMSVARQFHADNTEGETQEKLGDFLAQLALMSDLDSAEAGTEIQARLTLMTMHAAKGLEFPIVAIVGMEEGLFPHNRALNSADEMEEERRLMYVGMTRAEMFLMLTYARRRMIFGELKYSVPSRFLSEVPRELMTGSFSLDAEASPYSSYEERRYGSSRVDGAGRGEREKRGDGSRTSTPSSNSYARRDDGRLMPPSLPSTPRAEKPSTVDLSNLPVYKVGDRVAHAKFGEGKIAQVLGSGNKVLYNVEFERLSGKKLLDPRYAKLELKGE